MTRAFHGQLLGVVALVAATVAACGGGPDQPSPSPATTPAPPAAATSTATASPPPTTTPTTAPSPRATATASPSPTPVPATATPSPTAVAPAATTPRATATATPTPTPTPATSTPAPTPTAPDATTFLYDTYDASGAVDTPGSYAFLTDASSTTSTANTHDDLLDAAAIVVNVSDRDGASQAALYNNLEVGDVVEWYPVGYEDCWLRYKITALLPEPPGDPPRKRFAVKWLPVAHLMCVDDVLADELDVELRWHPPAAHSDPHGGLPTMLMDQPVPGGASYYVAPFSTLAVDVPEEMTLIRYTGWAFGRGRYTVGLEDVATGSYLVLDINTGEELGRLIQSVEGDSRDVGALFNRIVASARTVVAAPTGTATPSQTPTPATATATPTPTPVAPGAATTFRYDTYDTTGAVSTPGSYAFLSDPDDTSTVVTTYEALRDGTTTALLIHTSDADGVSRGSAYDAVEAGDLFEWHQADDCFVRYTVTEVKADPAGDVPKPESTDRSLRGRDAGLAESSGGVPAFAGGCRGRAGARSRRSARLGGAEDAGARVREACAGMLARASEPGWRCERASGRER